MINASITFVTILCENASIGSKNNTAKFHWEAEKPIIINLLYVLKKDKFKPFLDGIEIADILIRWSF